MISQLFGTLMTRAASIARAMSSPVIVWSGLVMATLTRLFSEATWEPAMPTRARSTL